MKQHSTVHGQCWSIISIPMIYPRIAAGLEYKDKGSHCPQRGKGGRIPLDATGKSGTELEGGSGLQDYSAGLIVKSMEKIVNYILVAYFCS